MRFKITIILIPSLLCGLQLPAAAQPMPLKNVKTYMFQFQGLDARGAIEKLARSDYDLLIIDDVHQAKGGQRVDMPGLVATLRAGKPARIVLAYFDLGAAETDRTYWSADWKAPRPGQLGHPDFLMGINPPGWEDTFLTLFWDKRWQDLMVDADDSSLARSLAAGFDGVLVDWVETADHPAISAIAAKQSSDARQSMADLLAKVRAAVRKVRPAGLVLTLNGAALALDNPKAREAIDGIICEGIWFTGKGDVSWNSADGGDVPNTSTGNRATDARLKQARALHDAGKAVFTLDYTLKSDRAQHIYANSRDAGLIPLVTRSSLGGFTTTPPPPPQ
ncbi:MAG: endo alpha-1,4 polygalactosaminidase [Tepidisphaeraceae bacterium]|jgi:uncharacterized protein (TIGR01370 family)